MPAVSKAQQTAAAIALHGHPKPGSAAAQMKRGMDKEELHKFASTKRKGLPKRKVKEEINVADDFKAMSFKNFLMLDESEIAEPGNEHWERSVARGKQHALDHREKGTSEQSIANLLYNQHQNVRKKHFNQFLKAVGVKATIKEGVFDYMKGAAGAVGQKVAGVAKDIHAAGQAANVKGLQAQAMQMIQGLSGEDEQVFVQALQAMGQAGKAALAAYAKWKPQQAPAQAAAPQTAVPAAVKPRIKGPAATMAPMTAAHKIDMKGKTLLQEILGTTYLGGVVKGGWNKGVEAVGQRLRQYSAPTRNVLDTLHQAGKEAQATSAAQRQQKVRARAEKFAKLIAMITGGQQQQAQPTAQPVPQGA